MNKNIRSLENMPLNIKFLYSKILGTMVCAGNDYNQLKVAAFYRIINKIELPSKERIQLIYLIIKNDIDFYNIFDGIDLNNHLNDQEKNIFRFSLMKDLINIMKADYVETDREKQLLDDIKNYFNISNEQFSFFIEEYKLDRSFFDDNISDNQFKNIIINTISAGAALGVPLATLYYSENFRSPSVLSTISNLKSRKIKRRRSKFSSILELSKHILLAIATFKVMKYILNIRKDEKTKLVELVKKNIQSLHESTKNIIYKDIEYFTNRISEFKYRGDQDLEITLEIINILERAVGTLENTGAVIL